MFKPASWIKKNVFHNHNAWKLYTANKMFWAIVDKRWATCPSHHINTKQVQYGATEDICKSIKTKDKNT